MFCLEVGPGPGALALPARVTVAFTFCVSSQGRRPLHTCLGALGTQVEGQQMGSGAKGQGGVGGRKQEGQPPELPSV